MKQLFAILLSGIMLFISLGPIMSNHYCGGELAQSTLGLGYGEVGCEMNQCLNCGSHESGNFVQKKGCCENEYLQFKLDENLSKANAYASKVHLDTHIWAINPNRQPTFLLKRWSPEYLKLIPPTIKQDLILLNQSFRI